MFLLRPYTKLFFEKLKDFYENIIFTNGTKEYCDRILDLIDPKNMKLRINSGLQEAYQLALADFKKGIYDFCKKRDIDYISIDTSEAIESVLFKQLLKVGIMS